MRATRYATRFSALARVERARCCRYATPRLRAHMPIRAHLRYYRHAAASAAATSRHAAITATPAAAAFAGFFATMLPVITRVIIDMLCALLRAL